MISSPSAPAPWGLQPIAQNDITCWQFGPLVIWCQVVGTEVWLASRRVNEGEPPIPPDVWPEDSEWSRWAVNHPPTEILLKPVFPDRPLVVSPEQPFAVVMGANARVYVRVPTIVAVALPHRRESPLVELATKPLSKTWFGEFDQGEHCYWLSSSARREPLSDPLQRHRVICPMHISNRAAEDLRVERICLRVGALGIYSEEGRLWSSVTSVVYRGGGEVSRIETGSGPPREVPQAVSLGEPRQPVRGTIRGRTFRTLESLSDFGRRLLGDSP